MDRSAGSVAKGCRIGAICVFAVLASGCSIGVATSAGFGTAFNIGLLLGIGSGASVGGGEMDPNRQVTEQDCSKPIENPSANLRCR